MFNIQVERIIAKPIQKVFDILSEHAEYKRFSGIDESSLITEGLTHKNGVGAVREVVANGNTLHEEIVKYQAPIQIAPDTQKTAIIGYQIIYSTPLPYKHQMGEIQLREIGANSTQAKWVSRGTITTPIIGKLFFDRKIQTNGSRAFGSILKYIDSL